MRVAVLGAGSLGSLLAGMLAQVQTAEVLIHGKGEHGAMMVAKGLHIEGEATFHLPQDAALFTLEEVGIPSSLSGTMDAVLLTGKGAAIFDLATLARGLLRPDGILVCLSNGLGHAEACGAVVGVHRVVAGTTTYAAWRPTPGRVQFAGKGNVIFGQIQGGPSEVDAKPLLDLFEQAGLDAEWTQNGPAAVWMKVLLNIAINPIAALCGVANGALLEPGLFTSSLETMLEGARIARQERIHLPDDLELEMHLESVLKATAENHCSMLQDVRAGRKTEIEFLNQAVVQRGERIGLRAPMNQMLSAMIDALTPQQDRR